MDTCACLARLVPDTAPERIPLVVLSNLKVESSSDPLLSRVRSQVNSLLYELRTYNKKRLMYTCREQRKRIFAALCLQTIAQCVLWRELPTRKQLALRSTHTLLFQPNRVRETRVVPVGTGLRKQVGFTLNRYVQALNLYTLQHYNIERLRVIRKRVRACQRKWSSLTSYWEVWSQKSGFCTGNILRFLDACDKLRDQEERGAYLENTLKKTNVQVQQASVRFRVACADVFRDKRLALAHNTSLLAQFEARIQPQLREAQGVVQRIAAVEPNRMSAERWLTRARSLKETMDEIRDEVAMGEAVDAKKLRQQVEEYREAAIELDQLCCFRAQLERLRRKWGDVGYEVCVVCGCALCSHVCVCVDLCSHVCSR